LSALILFVSKGHLSVLTRIREFVMINFIFQEEESDQI